MNKKLIVHLTYDLYGGVAMVAGTLIKKQLADGYDVAVAYVSEDNANLDSFVGCPLQKYKVDPPRFWGQTMLFGVGAKKVYNYFQKEYPQHEIVIHAHNVQTVGLLSRIKNIPLVCTLHSLHPSNMSIRHIISDVVYKLILRKLNRNNKPIVSVSECISAFYDPNKKYAIKTIHNGCIKPNCQKEKHNSFVIGHIGDISYAKGFDTTFEAYNLLTVQEKEAISFTVAGKTKTISEEQLKQMISQNHLENNIEYLGFVSDAANTVFPKIDVMILASHNEGLPMSIVEAFSLGIPVIATNVGGIGEIVKDGYNGFLIKSAQDITDRIRELYCDKALYDAMSRNAIKTYESEFSADKMHNNYLSEYDKVL